MNVEKEIRAIKELLKVHDKEFEEIMPVLKLNTLVAHEFCIYHGQRKRDIYRGG